jgi:hypothetical protein
MQIAGLQKGKGRKKENEKEHRLRPSLSAI